ncbi:MAG TPA: hypothetical protein VIG75_10490, partial [Citricoccus sp.]
RVVPRGGVGEICIGGVGLSRGYVNRPEVTAESFVPDTVGLPYNPSGRLYRTGDLGRVDEDGHIERLGRLDTRTPVRGYRMELTEIESVVLRQAVVAAPVPEFLTPRRSGTGRGR